MSGHAKIVKKSFTFRLLQQMKRHRLKHKIPLTKISAETGITRNRIKNSEITGNMTWFELALLLYFYKKWFVISLIDDTETVLEKAETDIDDVSI